MISDSVIKQRVEQELQFDSECYMANVMVAVKNGVVTIAGSICNNTIEKPYSAIARKVVTEVKKYSPHVAQAVRVKMVNDEVILEGIVQSWRERQQAQQIAWSSLGVKKVKDHITVAA